MVAHRKGWRGAAASVALLALAACSDKATDRVAASAPVDTTIVSLSPLTEGDLTRHPLMGELGCSFTTGDRDVVLVAKGDVASREPAQALAKVSGVVDRLSAPRGFDGLPEGAVFTGTDKTLRVTPNGPPLSGGESPARAASLSYERPGGASQTFEGRWTCGP